MEKLRYHTLRKPRKLKNGKTVHRWYYYWVDETGKEIQRSCGTAVKSRQAAEDFIRTLPPPPKAQNAPGGAHVGFRANNADLLVGDIAKDMFVTGSDHVKRRQQLKKSVSPEALSNNRVFMRHIIGTWGSRMLRTLEMDEVMGYLFAVERSASWKNQYIAALNEIYQEGQFMGCKVYKPDFPHIGKTPNKADILSQDEIERFFRRENFRHDFFLFFLCALSGGMRLGEVRALRAKQVVFEKSAVIIDGFIKKSGIRTMYNKCGSPEHPKLRVVPFPDYTLNLLDGHIRRNNVAPEAYVFTYGGQPISTSMAKTNFILALINAGIAYDKKSLVEKGYWKGGHIHITKDLIPDGRRIVIHSLRYTYITLMSRSMDAHNLLKLTGHNTTAMIDYYNRTNLDMALAAIPDAAKATSGLLPHSIGEL